MIDTKMDDALPGGGVVRGQMKINSSCSTTNDPTTAIYDLTSQGPACLLEYITGF